MGSRLSLLESNGRPLLSKVFLMGHHGDSWFLIKSMGGKLASAQSARLARPTRRRESSERREWRARDGMREGHQPRGVPSPTEPTFRERSTSPIAPLKIGCLFGASFFVLSFRAPRRATFCCSSAHRPKRPGLPLLLSDPPSYSQARGTNVKNGCFSCSARSSYARPRRTRTALDASHRAVGIRGAQARRAGSLDPSHRHFTTTAPRL